MIKTRVGKLVKVKNQDKKNGKGKDEKTSATICYNCGLDGHAQWQCRKP